MHKQARIQILDFRSMYLISTEDCVSYLNESIRPLCIYVQKTQHSTELVDYHKLRERSSKNLYQVKLHVRLFSIQSLAQTHTVNVTVVIVFIYRGRVRTHTHKLKCMVYL